MFKIFISILLLIGFGSPWQARAAKVTLLAADPTWLGLIQVYGGVKTGGPHFYWAPQAATAEQELRASISAVQNPDLRPVFACRFPARFYFLSHRLGLADAKEQLDACDRLKASIEMDRINGISLILVGSYLSNPASSFGHTLLRLHQRSAGGVDKDLSFNYGAFIPPNEHVAAYIAKGVFGHYSATYSDQEPFVHDITYNHLENRDSWSYTLRHTPEDRLLIALHLWEMTGQKFQYFFFSRNCAWQMANTLQLTLAVRHQPPVAIPYWTLPVDVVHGLKDQGLVEQVTHVPSHQRRMNLALNRLSEPDARRFLRIIHEGVALDPKHDGADLMNAVIDYHTWRNASNVAHSEQDRRHIALREQAVHARLQLPPDTGDEDVNPEPSFADGNKPIKFAVGYQGGPDLSWAVYSQGPLDPHALGVGHIRAIVVEAARTSDQWQIKNFTFLDIERIQAKDPFGLSRFSHSWRIKFDWDRGDGLQPRAKGGLGLSHVAKDWSATLYGDLTLTPHGLRADPALSLVHRGDQTQSLVEISGNGQHSAALQHQINKTYFVGVRYDKRKSDSLGLSFGRYW